MNLSSVIENKAFYADYIIDDITHVCKDLPKRDPGSEGEKQCCEYFAEVLEKDCGCDPATIKLESFEENPHSFFGWIYIAVSFALVSLAFLFIAPVVSAVLCIAAAIIAVLQFGLYKKVVDFLFPKKTGHNVMGIRPCTGEVKRRIFFNGHVDACWEWPVNYLLGGVGFEAHAVIGFGGLFYYMILAIISLFKGNALHCVNGGLLKAALWGLIFVPFLIGLYFLWNPKHVVDGANDNLTGCYMGIAILKAMQDLNISLENTEVGVIITGSE